MSNRKRPKREFPLESSPNETVVLTERNKEEVAKLFSYSLETVENILKKARNKGYDAVRLSYLNPR